MLMFDHDDSYQDNPAAVGKGILLGITMGAIMWAGIIGAIVYLVK